MSFNFQALPVGVFPSPTTPVAKDIQCKAVKLTFADFTTGGTAAVKAYLPADASILSIRSWGKTAYSGNGVTAISLSIGITGTVTKYINAFNLGITAGLYQVMTPISNIAQEWDPTTPGGDIPLLFTGTATTGNPTAGETVIFIEYVR